MKNHEIYGALLQKFNNKQYVFTIDELIDDLGKRSKSDIERALVALLREHIIRLVQPGVYEFRCDYRQLRQYMIDLDRPIASKKKIESEIISKEELMSAGWVLDMDASDDFDEMFDDIDDDEDEDDDDDLLSMLDDLESSVLKKGNDIAAYNKAKEAVTKYMESRTSDKDGGVSLFMNITYPSGTPFKIGFYYDDDKRELLFTDRAATYQYILSLMDTSDILSNDMAQAILEKLEDECSLKCVKNMLCIPISFDDTDDDELDYDVLIFKMKINNFLSKKVSWLTNSKTSSDDDLDTKVSSFIIKTMPNTYAYSDEKMFEAVTISFIERIILVDYRLSRERAVEIAKTLQSYWANNNAPQSTLKIIGRVRQEFELCSDLEYAQLKAQLYTKE